MSEIIGQMTTKNMRLAHHHLIDGKYLAEDCIPMLRQNIEELLGEVVCSRLMPMTKGCLDEFFKQFEHECATYNVSHHYTPNAKGNRG